MPVIPAVIRTLRLVDANMYILFDDNRGAGSGLVRARSIAGYLLMG